MCSAYKCCKYGDIQFEFYSLKKNKLQWCANHKYKIKSKETIVLIFCNTSKWVVLLFDSQI